MTADWIVSKITASGDSYYRLWVTLENESDGGREVTWHVRDVSDRRYDLSEADIDPKAIPYLGRITPDCYSCQGTGFIRWARHDPHTRCQCITFPNEV